MAQAAWDSGVSRLPGPPNDWLEYVADLMWWPNREEKAGDWVKQVGVPAVLHSALSCGAGVLVVLLVLQHRLCQRWQQGVCCLSLLSG